MKDKIFNCVVVSYKSTAETNKDTNVLSTAMSVEPFIMRGYSAEEVKARLMVSLSKVDLSKTEYDRFDVQVLEVDRGQIEQLLINSVHIVTAMNDSIFDDSIFDEDILE